MRIGISRTSQSQEEAYEVLSTAKRYGFEGVQLKPAQYGEFIGSPAAFLQRYGALAALSRGGLIVYPGGDPSAWREQAEDVLQFACAIRAEHICFCSGVYSTNASDGEVLSVAKALTAIGEQARQNNLIISIHNHVDSLVETEEDIARLLEKLDPSLCGLTLDTAHAAKAGISEVAHLIHRFERHLLNVHLKDLDFEGEFCALGQGTIDIAPILEALKSIQYAHWLIVDEETAGMSTEETFCIARDCLHSQGMKL